VQEKLGHAVRNSQVALYFEKQQRDQEMFLKWRAVMKMQRWYRVHHAQRTAAAVLIQRHYRGMTARKAYLRSDYLRAKTHAAAEAAKTQIQETVRRHAREAKEREARARWELRHTVDSCVAELCVELCKDDMLQDNADRYDDTERQALLLLNPRQVRRHHSLSSTPSSRPSLSLSASLSTPQSSMGVGASCEWPIGANDGEHSQSAGAEVGGETFVSVRRFSAVMHATTRHPHSAKCDHRPVGMAMNGQYMEAMPECELDDKEDTNDGATRIQAAFRGMRYRRQAREEARRTRMLTYTPPSEGYTEVEERAVVMLQRAVRRLLNSTQSRCVSRRLRPVLGNGHTSRFGTVLSLERSGHSRSLTARTSVTRRVVVGWLTRTGWSGWMMRRSGHSQTFRRCPCTTSASWRTRTR
jgi:hypothetical protein